MSRTSQDTPSKPRQAYEIPNAKAYSKNSWNGALIEQIEPQSPAAREGLEAGMRILYVNGEELRDMITWSWEASDYEVYLEGIAYENTPDEFEFECTPTRELGEDWGITFDGAVFDGMRICRNNCVFCFMKMLPKDMRRSLYLRDDDYRLSFLQGNFVTLTNITDEDIDRIVSLALSPLNVSLHAISPDVRAQLMGKNAQRGLDVLNKLLNEQIEVHAQIVLVPHMNDGEELLKTLEYIESQPMITSLGIVPLGYTKHQSRFSDSYTAHPDEAAAVIDTVRPFQERARKAYGRTKYQLADEFYLAAQTDPPAAEYYDGYPQFDDGIGMVRTYLDEALETIRDTEAVKKLEKAAATLHAQESQLVIVSGCAAKSVVERFLQQSPLRDVSYVLAVKNTFFGGNVNVTGLLTAADVLPACERLQPNTYLILPQLMFNTQNMTLDNLSHSEVLSKLESYNIHACIALTTPRGILQALSTIFCLC